MDINEWLNRANKKRHQLKSVKPGSNAERRLRDEISEIEWEIQQAIDDVSDARLREVLALRYVLGMTTVEIAKDLGCSARSVRRKINKAQAALSPEKF